MTLYMFLALLFVLFLYFPVQERFVGVITVMQMAMGWTLFLEGAWVIFGSILCTFYSKVLVVSPILKTLKGIVNQSVHLLLVYFLISIVLDIVNTLITGGFSYGSL